MNKLSIGFVFDDSLDSSDGVAQQVKLLGGWLSARGHKVFYMCGQAKTSEIGGDKVYSLAKNLGVRFNGNHLSMPIWSNRREIQEVLAKEQPDVLHVTVPYSPFLAQRIIRLASRSAIVGSFHILPMGWLASAGAWLLGIFQWRSLKLIDTFSATSPKASEFARSAMRIKSRVIPNAVDTQKFVNKAKPVPQRIVFLGRLVQRKGCRELIEAFELLTIDFPQAELVIAGDGLQRLDLEKLVARKRLSDRVKFLGFIDEAEKPKLLGSAAIACFPSLGGESFGVVLLEAMAAGSGVVLGGNNPGYQSVLGKHSELLFNPRNPRQLADRLALFLNNTALASKMHAWQEQEIKRYDINVVGAEFEQIYYQQIADKRAAKA